LELWRHVIRLTWTTEITVEQVHGLCAVARRKLRRERETN
jgi:hypothetical protein